MGIFKMDIYQSGGQNRGNDLSTIRRRNVKSWEGKFCFHSQHCSNQGCTTGDLRERDVKGDASWKPSAYPETESSVNQVHLHFHWSHHRAAQTSPFRFLNHEHSRKLSTLLSKTFYYLTSHSWHMVLLVSPPSVCAQHTEMATFMDFAQHLFTQRGLFLLWLLSETASPRCLTICLFPNFIPALLFLFCNEE